MCTYIYTATYIYNMCEYVYIHTNRLYIYVYVTYKLKVLKQMVLLLEQSAGGEKSRGTDVKRTEQMIIARLKN